MITSIVVGFDGSEPSERAVKLACVIAAKFDASLQISHTARDETVAFAAEAISGFYVGPNVADQEVMLQAAQKVAKRAEDLAAAAGQAGVEVHIGQGDPVDDLLARADAASADLIVTGRRGLGNLRGLMLGSTSNGISARAHCACVTVP